jgi:tRNA (cytosine49-C5)-methyltransferase
MGKRKKKKKQVFSGPIPEEFFTRLTDMFGQSLASELTKTFAERPTTFRINPFVSSEQEVLDILKQEGFTLEEVPWLSRAFILKNKEKRDLCDLGVYTDCMVYLQSLASMVPPFVLDPQPGEHVLDLTAAPGSKTSQMAVMMNRTGELVANDKNKIRFFKLKHNMEQLGVFGEEKDDWKLLLRMENGVDLVREYPEYFDKILLDAPCSAESRFVEGKSKSYGYWKERKIKEMAYTQRKLLLSAWEALKPGGTLVYSTCTFAPEENELQISLLLDRMEDAEVLPIEISTLKTLPILKEWKGKKIHEDVQKCLRVKPTKNIEGFFVAKVRKNTKVEIS